MKLTVYQCDACGKFLSGLDEEINHLSINFGESGLAYKDDDWELKSIFSGIKQFCNTDCMSQWVGKRLVACDE